MAKQRKVESISEDLGACVIHSDDVAAIAAILKAAAGPNDRVRISVPGFSLDEAADFETLDEAPDELSLRLALHDDLYGINVRFSARYTGSGYGPDNATGHGVLTQVKNYLDRRCRPSFNWLTRPRRFPLEYVVGLAVQIVVTVALGSRGTLAFALGMVANVAVMVSLTVLSFKRQRCWIYITTRKARRASFFKRNADSIVAAVIAGVIVALVTHFVDMLERRGSAGPLSAGPSGSAAPSPSAPPLADASADTSPSP